MSLMRDLWSSFGYGPQLWRPHETSVMEHRQLVDALAASDAEQAAGLTRQHVLGSIKWMRARLSSDGDGS